MTCKHCSLSKGALHPVKGCHSGQSILGKRLHNAGFTLLEVLVALGIAATSLVALYTLAGQLNSNSAALDARQWALWCADNRMIAVAMEVPAPPVGETEHTCQQGLQTYTVVQNISTTPNPRMRRVEISTYVQAQQRQERMAFLATVIPVQGATP